MMITLRDERGSPLSKASAHAYRPPRPVLLDFTTRPDALFRYYFDHSGRSVVVAIGATIWMGSLATRWRMGVRSWFLHDLHRLRVAAVERDSSSAEVAPVPVRRRWSPRGQMSLQIV